MTKSGTTDRRTPRAGALIVGAVAFAAVGALLAWALMTVLEPAEDPLDVADHTYVEVSAGTVGSSIQLNAVAEWPPVTVGANRVDGVVTSVDLKPGAEF